MRLEEGKFYELNGGDTIEVLRVLKNPIYKASEVVCIFTYQDSHHSKPRGMSIDGIWNNGGRDHDYSVKREIKKGETT